MSRRQTYISSGSAYEDQIGFSRALVDGDWVFVSGTTGFNHRDMSIDDDVAEQTRVCLGHIATALAEAGAKPADIVRVRYILPNPDDFEACWPQLRAFFGDHRPAATMIAAGLIDPRVKIEIEVTARLATD
ncbi:MAG: RidA family protein [Planctomycetota bacterium]